MGFTPPVWKEPTKSPYGRKHEYMAYDYRTDPSRGRYGAGATNKRNDEVRHHGGHRGFIYCQIPEQPTLWQILKPEFPVPPQLIESRYTSAQTCRDEIDRYWER